MQNILKRKCMHPQCLWNIKTLVAEWIFRDVVLCPVFDFVCVCDWKWIIQNLGQWGGPVAKCEVLHEFCTLIKEEEEEELLLLTKQLFLLTAQRTRMYRQVGKFTVDTGHFTHWLNCKQRYSGNRLSVDELHDVQGQDMLQFRVVSFFSLFFLFFLLVVLPAWGKVKWHQHRTSRGSFSHCWGSSLLHCMYQSGTSLPESANRSEFLWLGKGLNCLHAVVMIDVA